MLQGFRRGVTFMNAISLSNRLRQVNVSHPTSYGTANVDICKLTNPLV